MDDDTIFSGLKKEVAKHSSSTVVTLQSDIVDQESISQNN